MVGDVSTIPGNIRRASYTEQVSTRRALDDWLEETGWVGSDVGASVDAMRWSPDEPEDEIPPDSAYGLMTYFALRPHVYFDALGMVD